MDNLTGLVWTREANRGGFPLAWPEALELAREMNRERAQGFADWRLPNRRELFSLMSFGDKKPALAKGHPFQGVFLGWFWSSTSAAVNPAYAWYVHTEGGRMFYGKKSQAFLAWPCRGACNGLLAATGQTECFDADGQPAACPGSGQDGEYLSGAPWPGPRFEPGEAGVLDRLTGLVWARNADPAGRALRWRECFGELARLNEVRKGGPPWRMPSITELESLVDASAHSPALPAGHPFKNCRQAYWSATNSAFEPDWSMALYLNKGAVGVGQKKGEHFHLWPVRSHLARQI